MLCESCGFAAAIETVPDRRHRVPSTYRLCRDCAAEARGVLMPPRTENHDARLAMLRALAAHNGPMTREMLLVAIAAEEDEKRMLHGVISGLIRSPFVTSAGANLYLTPEGRRQVEPVPAPPTEKPEIPVPPVAYCPPGLEAVQLTAAIERVGIQGRDLLSRAELLNAAREAIEVMEQRSGSLITALRAIEAALPGGPTGLRADAIADRAVGLLHGCVDGAREREALRQERDDSQREYAALDDVFEGEKTPHAETRAALAAAEAEITRLRADLEGAIAAEKAATTDGHYWIEQGGRHVLAILRPVEVAVLNVLDTGRSLYWEAGPHSGRVDASSPEALGLAQRLAEVAAGVRS